MSTEPGYDDLNRLLTATGSAYGSQSFTYDAIGNMTNKHGQTMTYGAGAAGPHAVTEVTSTQRPTWCPPAPAACTMDYDANGNMTTRGWDTLTYDSENRIKELRHYETQNGSTNYTFKPGWNVISFTHLPDNQNVANVLSPLTFGTDYDQVSTWDSTSGTWKHWVNDSDFNDFTSFEYGKTYEIYNKTGVDKSLTVTGKTLAVDIAHSIKAGDNFISPPIKTATNVTTVLSGLTLNTHYSDVKRFNATTQTWESYVGGAFTQFEPGKGYNIIGLTNTSFSYGKTETISTFVYDSTGARVKKTAGSTTTVYLGKDYDITGGVSTKYIFLGDRRIANKDSGGTTLYYHEDHINSSNIITDASGNQAAMYEYDPYGLTATHTGTVDVKHQFTGQEKDDSTKLHYYNARYYDSQLGRFITADPTVLEPENPQELNRYTYANNNPVKFTDPTGFKGFWKKLFKALLIAVVVVVAVAVVVLTAGLIASALAPAGISIGSGALAVGEVAAGSAVAAGGISGGEIIAGAAVVGGAVGTSVSFSEAQKTIDPNSQTTSIHFSENSDWLNRLKDAAAGGPGPNLMPQTSSPSGGPPMPGASSQGVVVANGASGLLVNQGIAVSQGAFYNAKGSQPEKKNRSTKGRQGKLKEIANNPNTPRWIRGFLNNFFKQKGWYKLPGNEPRGGGNAFELAHRRGFESRKGYDYSHTDLQESGLHKAQHAIERQNS